MPLRRPRLSLAGGHALPATAAPIGRRARAGRRRRRSQRRGGKARVPEGAAIPIGGGARAASLSGSHWPGGTGGPLRRPLFSLAGGARAARCSAPPAPPLRVPLPPALTGRVGGSGSRRGAEVEGHGADRGTASGGPRERRVRAPAAGPATNKTGRTRRFSAAAKALPGGAGDAR